MYSDVELDLKIAFRQLRTKFELRAKRATADVRVSLKRDSADVNCNFAQ